MAVSDTSLRPRQSHSFGLGDLVGLIIAAVIGVLLIGPWQWHTTAARRWRPRMATRLSPRLHA